MRVVQLCARTSLAVAMDVCTRVFQRGHGGGQGL